MEKLGPGLHADIPMEVYHSDCCLGPSVSGSDLVRMDESCPAVAFERWSGNPDRIEEDGTLATTFGRAFHALILEGEPVFRRQFAVKPEGLSLATIEGKAWKRDHAGQEILSHDDGLKLFAMSRAISRDPLASKAFIDGTAEVTAIARDPATGLYLKTRPDWLRGGSGRLAFNLKTAASAKPDAWRRQAYELGYFISAAVSVDVLSTAGGSSYDHAFVVVEKEPPFCCVVYVITAEVIEWGRVIYRKALDQFARCIERNHWPGYADKVIEVDLPAWAKYRLEERDARGEFETQTKPEAITA